MVRPPVAVAAWVEPIRRILRPSALATRRLPVAVPRCRRGGSQTRRLLKYDDSSTRLFGSKPNNGGPPGKVLIVNEQEALDLDLDRLRTTVDAIRRLIGTNDLKDSTMYHTYDVSLFLIDDDEMRTTNLESRGMDAPTDILSFPFHEAIRPGLLKTPDFDIPDYYNLGDLLIDVPYVIRSCLDDQDEAYATSDEEYECDDRGVSGAMANVQDPEQRVNMLLVHGMLHLVGYDHEEDDEYEQMVTKEEEIMKALQMV